MTTLLIVGGFILLVILFIIVSICCSEEKENQVKVEAERLLDIHDKGFSVLPYSRTLSDLYGGDFLIEVCKEVHKQRPSILIDIRPRSDR